MEDIKVALHIFLTVLACGTGWRLASYHLIASPVSFLERLGEAMSFQY